MICTDTMMECLAIRLLFGRPLDRHGFLGLPFSKKLEKGQEFDGVDGSDDELIPEQWFHQRLDHFDLTNRNLWKQRFFVNDKFYTKSKNDAPVFLQLGGEGEANPVWLKEGQVATNYGPHFKALLLLLEHRYYGKSFPTSDMTTENLRYLTSEQALQDTANFIEFIKKEYNLTESNKWIVFGGSYSGSLAAWFRMKYPHLVAGALASSAPVEALINFADYVKVVDASLGEKCVAQIKSATRHLTQLLKSKIIGQNLMSSLAGNFEGIVQYNKDNREFEGAVDGNITIEVLCSIMTDVTSYEKAIDRLAEVNQILMKVYETKCLDYKYEKFISKMKVVEFNQTEFPGARQWTYQTCTEFGFFQTSDAAGQPFGNYFPLNFYTQQCIDIFGKNFNEEFIESGISFTNSYYGSKNLQVTNVIFSNGMIDPWHALGILKSINPTAIPLLMQETAHCADLYPSSDSDPKSLRQARKTIRTYLTKFLGQ
ncbi:Putative serine protease K12H4.7 [Sarcoptes scabiei]|uniref:Putative serine protease K12H4.7 n=1 Tax=Sarcoptes scabiei TaxID=52283 RepID=A0A834VCD8_SARSC|nr:Putative serine protease K12H4.7 [Sarcoptes scabiei]